MPGVEQAGPPANWERQNGGVHCLACRRELAADAGLDNAPDDASVQRRQQLKSEARIEFEVKRNPDEGNAVIARACRSSVAAVQKARERLDA